MIVNEVLRIVDNQDNSFSTQLERVEAFLGELNAAGVHIKKAQYNICDGINEISFNLPSKTSI